MNRVFNNIPLNTDSYKLSHPEQLPEGTEFMSSYIEARDGKVFDQIMMAGTQPLLKEYMTTPVTADDVELAAEVSAEQQMPFYRAGWEEIVNKHGGRLPLSISALPEGMVVPVGTAMVQTINTDKAAAWLPGHVETPLLRAIWYQSTVATLSWTVKRDIYASLLRTCMEPDEQILYRLHDFGARGASSQETAALGGVSHLFNFRGTDTLAAMLAARVYYNTKGAGGSIPAAEHSTITSWKRERESAAFKNMLKQYGQKGAYFAVVSDSYDVHNAVKNIVGGELKDQLIASGSTLVVRPDSGDPIDIVPAILRQLAKDFGAEKNKKGYLVLNPAVRVIQGDGMNLQSIRSLLRHIEISGFSTENVAFGMGGGLLQSVTRDTAGFAMKCSSICTEADGWYDVYKDPITASSKRSKRGVQAVTYRDGEIVTMRQDQMQVGDTSLLREVYRDGRLLIDEDLATIRARADAALMASLA